MVERKTGTYYWIYSPVKSRKVSRNFKTITEAKKWMMGKIKKDKRILGKNTLIFTKSILSDIDVGSFGISGKWNKA